MYEETLWTNEQTTIEIAATDNLQFMYSMKMNLTTATYRPNIRAFGHISAMWVSSSLNIVAIPIMPTLILS